LPVRRATSKNSARRFAVQAARLAEDCNGSEIIVLDLRHVSPVTDFFVISTGTSGRQMRTTAEELAAYGKSVGQPVWHIEGKETGQWIVLDFVDVVVHLFDQDRRHYYDLELIWGDAPRVNWQRKRRAAPDRANDE